MNGFTARKKLQLEQVTDKQQQIDKRFTLFLSLFLCHRNFGRRHRDIPKQKSCGTMSGHAWNKDSISECHPWALQKQQHVIPYLSNWLLSLQRRNEIAKQGCTSNIIACEIAQCFDERRKLKDRCHYLTLLFIVDLETFWSKHSNNKQQNKSS